jgi:hypothetical protein
VSGITGMALPLTAAVFLHASSGLRAALVAGSGVMLLGTEQAAASPVPALTPAALEQAAA